jgi:radical SAM protein with 4Fe4S-binding SPASM domain
VSLKSFFNRLKLFRDYLLRKPKVSSYPVEYYLDISEVCNLNCPMCSCTILHKDKNRAVMQLDTFKTIIRKIKEYAGFILLTGKGEPLLNPNFIEFVRICKAEGIRVGTSTNCTPLTEEMSRNIIESGLDYIIFPVESTDKEEYEKIRVGAKFETVVSNINRFLLLKKQMKSDIFVVIQSLSPEKKLGASYKKYRQQVLDLFKDNSKYINSIRLKPLIDFHKIKHWHTKPCLLLWRNAFINFEGNVLSCFADVNEIFVFGNILQEDLMSAWNSEKMQYLRKMNSRPDTMNKLETCQYCDLRNEYSNTWALLTSSFVGPFLSRKLYSLYERLFM